MNKKRTYDLRKTGAKKEVFSHSSNCSQSIRVSTVLAIQSQKYQLDQYTLIVTMLLYVLGNPQQKFR